MSLSRLTISILFRKLESCLNPTAIINVVQIVLLNRILLINPDVLGSDILTRSWRPRLRFNKCPLKQKEPKRIHCVPFVNWINISRLSLAGLCCSITSDAQYQAVYKSYLEMNTNFSSFFLVQKVLGFTLQNSFNFTVYLQVFILLQFYIVRVRKKGCVPTLYVD